MDFDTTSLPGHVERHTWAAVAAAYSTYASPFRPCHEDLTFVEKIAFEWRRGHAKQVPMRVLTLGVTPDLATLPWPDRVQLVALDQSSYVVKALWPRDVPAGRWPVCGNWQLMPIFDGFCHLVVGDGSLIAFRYPDELRSLVATIRRVLTRDGGAVIRCFVQPEVPESPDGVIDEMLRSGIVDINHFKFRLCVSMQRSTRHGSPVRETYDFLKSRVTDGVLKSQPGWSEAAVEGFEIWRNAETVYTFPTLAEVRDVLDTEFKECRIYVPTYPLGRSCPTFYLRPRP